MKVRNCKHRVFAEEERKKVLARENKLSQICEIN